MLISEKEQQDIEFDKIKEMLIENCYGEKARRQLSNQKFFTDRNLLITQLAKIQEWTNLYVLSEAPQYVPYRALDQHMKELRPKDSVIDLEMVLDIRDIILIYDKLVKIAGLEEIERKAPFLLQMLGEILEVKPIVKEINNIIDKDGKVRDDASDELVNIRRKQRKVEGEISKAFQQALKKYASHLIDTKESFKSGKRVLAVKSEKKREVRGLMHDESSTGKTVFIEPEDVVVLNHKVFELEIAERKEIYKIIRTLCGFLRDHLEVIQLAEDQVVLMDQIQAKSRLARKINGVLPKIESHPHMEWKQAMHPLLWLKNLEEKKKTVPSDIALFGKNQLLLISGPNAGGKSISLKTSMLLQCMLQFGLLVPCDENSKVGIFRKIMVDIGDQQSIENDLSTYSSRLKTMERMLRVSDENTLIGIDEFGSGTDPATGGALAEAILHEFIKRKCWGVVTTHYSNLKVFAFKNQGIVNAAMNFDQNNLTPTYQLTIGKPGSSFAFEIAQKMKLPAKVIKYAKNRLGDKKVKVEDLLVSIQSEKNQLEKELKEIKAKESNLDKLIETYTSLQNQLDYKRKKLKLESRERKLGMEAEFNRQLENTIREIQETKNSEQAKAVAKKRKEKRSALAEEVEKLQDEVFQFDTEKQEPLRKGDFVRLKNGDVTGEIESLNKTQATVIFGGLKMVVPMTDLKKVHEPIAVNSRSKVTTQIQQKSTTFKSKIDIRGLKMEDAQAILESFLDEAVVVGVSRLEILHGKGSGVLRRVVKNKAKEYKQVTSITHPDPERGGEGISIVHLD